MTQDEALKEVWEHMHMGHTLKKADVIFVLGNRDIRVAAYAAKLYQEGWASYILFSGSGDIHNSKPGREQFAGSTEAEIFTQIAIKAGVPQEAILVENKSQNTGQNYEFSKRLLLERGIQPKTVIAVQKPYMERRTYATGKVQWPEVELIVTSPHIPMNEYGDDVNGVGDHWIHAMVGDLQRIKEYPSKGFQIPQEIPSKVWKAYEFLVSLGYTDRLIKD
jgi:uncharacterized SAM-binding protein YcdF (DUF218 family)